MLHAPVSENKTQDRQSKTQSEPESERRALGWAGSPGLGLGGENGATVRNERAQGWQPINLSSLSQGGILQRKCACGSSAGSAGTCGECQSKEGGVLQTKLSIGAPDDKYEQEADRVADEVMRIPESAIQPSIGSEQKGGIQRKAIANSITPLQRSSTAPNQSAEVPDIVHDVLRSPGQPLDSATRALMEPRFGRDFSQVRVHTGGDADRSARDVNARAYTVGQNVVFSSGEYKPNTDAGKHLLAHELVHVMQQSLSRRGFVSTADPPAGKLINSAEHETDRVADTMSGFNGVGSQIENSPLIVARKPLDVSQIDKAVNQAKSVNLSFNLFNPLNWLMAASPQLLGHQDGEIAFAANYPSGVAPKNQPASPVPKADKPTVPVDTSIPIEAHFFPSGRLQSTERALIFGGFHGDEHPGWEVIEALIAELSAPTTARPLFFHTIVVPRVNAGGIADELGGLHFWRNRCNRQFVDLNRNFPTGNTPRDTDCANTVGAPIQPEVQGAIDLIKNFKPDRILSTHAISTPEQAGVFADPNNDPAAIALARGMASTVDPSNRPFNRLTDKSFNQIYPRDSLGKVSGGTSLGAFAPTATGGNIPTITMEAPSFNPLASTGTRSKKAFLRPVRAFLTDPALLDTKADEDILTDIDSFTAAERVGFLTGRLPFAHNIYSRIRLRIDTAVAKLNHMSPPQAVRIVSGLRLYSQTVPGSTGGSAQAQIVYNKFFLSGNPPTESFPTSFFNNGDRSQGIDRNKWLAEPSASRLSIILKFSSLPGTSRHHWGTDVDFNSTTSADWASAASATSKQGSFFDLGIWLQANAAKAGFVQSYTAGRTGGYNEEQWHYSYAPIAIGLRQRYNSQVNLSTDVANAFLADMKARAKTNGLPVPNDLDAAVNALKIGDFINTIDPGL